MALTSIASAEPASQKLAFPPLGPNIKALLIWPQMPHSFWNPGQMPGARELSQIPPLGLLTIAALCPKHWTIRFIDAQIEPVPDDAILEADLVMLSGMHVQKQFMRNLLDRARRLGKRTIVGGPYASSEPEALLPFADHVVIGEPDNVFSQIAADLENGTAQARYEIHDKPDLAQTPVPRFDLLKLDRYAMMAIQFSRGCPFQCEFCDIITIYGRTPRTKPPAHVLAELEMLFQLGWRKSLFIVDDNFIGHHKRALDMSLQLQQWSDARGRPFLFVTEASIDLAQRPALIKAMVDANFFGVFIGIESPSKESLEETRKFQNLRVDALESIRLLQQAGLWVTGGFIIGFDSDTLDIFDRQREFVQRTGIAWAMLGFLQAPPTTPLHRRMQAEGRLLPDNFTSNFHPPNFRTLLPREILLRRFRETLLALYEPLAYYERSFRSLEYWHPQGQKAPALPITAALRLATAAIWRQGICSDYRREWWRFLRKSLRWAREPLKMWWAITLLAAGHHFIRYAREVAKQLEDELLQMQDYPA